MLRYLEVKQAILDQIANQAPNTRLPSRAKMCAKFLISRTTIDKAIDSLVSEGYLYAVAGSGTYVADMVAEKSMIDCSEVSVGVLIPSIVHDTYPGVLRGIQDVMQKQNINVIVYNTDNDIHKQHSCLQRLLHSNIQGLLVVPTILKKAIITDVFYQEFQHLKIPIVFCNRSIEGIKAPLVCSNNFYGGYIATKHLLEKGYHRIAYLSALHYQTSTARFHGYLSALWEKGVPIHPELIKETVDEYSRVDLGYVMMKELLQKTSDIDGVFCFNDQIACGAINAIHESGLLVSKDIGVIGYDNSTLCDVPSEKLTSVSFKKYEIGLEAAKLLIQMITNPNRTSTYTHILQPEICIRETCLGKG